MATLLGAAVGLVALPFFLASWTGCATSLAESWHERYVSRDTLTVRFFPGVEANGRVLHAGYGQATLDRAGVDGRLLDAPESTRIASQAPPALLPPTDELVGVVSFMVRTATGGTDEAPSLRPRALVVVRDSKGRPAVLASYRDGWKRYPACDLEVVRPSFAKTLFGIAVVAGAIAVDIVMSPLELLGGVLFGALWQGRDGKLL